MVTKGNPAWFYPHVGEERIPAVVVEAYGDPVNHVDLLLDENGAISGRGSVTWYDGESATPTGAYAVAPAADDQPDVDKIHQEAEFRLYPGDENNQSEESDE